MPELDRDDWWKCAVGNVAGWHEWGQEGRRGVPPTGNCLSQAPLARPVGTYGYVHTCSVLCIAGQVGGIAVRPLKLSSLGAGVNSGLIARIDSRLRDLQRHPHLKRRYTELKRDSYLL